MELLRSGIIGFLQEPMLIFHLLWAYLLGFFFGAVPGLTATLAISLLLPFFVTRFEKLRTCNDL